jgi:hypothetical protein
MATTADTLAAKQAKQKKILIVLGVLLIAIAAFQGPKLWRQVTGSSTSAADTSTEQEQAAAASAAAAATGDATASATPGAATSPSAALVGVRSVRARPAPGAGQLRSFTLFAAKDPFVQSLPEETSGATTPTAEPTLSDTEPGKNGSGNGKGSSDTAKSGGNGEATTSDSSTASSGSSSESAPPEAAPEYATIGVNGSPQPLELQQTFPKQGKQFVLLALKPKMAKIGIAGGKLVGGKTLKLQMGKSVTLVNTATGARYVLKLLYTGSAPEQVKEFSQGASAAK